MMMEDADTNELGREFQIGIHVQKKNVLTKIMVRYWPGLKFIGFLW